MSKISRADSKARFRTGMYPTQADFENLHDSYVHKDDTIPLEQVGTNGATVVSLLNQKANSSHTHEIADVNGLQAFINKGNTFLDTVDASDDTINRWKEIESFLQGITDTETLTGLLADLKSEIEGDLSIDATLSSTSEHALQNKVLYDELRITETGSGSVLSVNGTNYPIETIDALTLPDKQWDYWDTWHDGMKVLPVLDPNKAYKIINVKRGGMQNPFDVIFQNNGSFILQFPELSMTSDDVANNVEATYAPIVAGETSSNYGDIPISTEVGKSDWVRFTTTSSYHPLEPDPENEYPYTPNENITYYGYEIGSPNYSVLSSATETTGSVSTVNVKSLKTKIAELEARLAAVPSNYIEFATDMSAYASAPTGKIVAYFGTTTNDFRRGLFYEKTASGWQNIPVSPVIS